MAIYHLHAKMIGRSSGRSAVAAAAYRSASELADERLGRSHDFTNKSGLIHSEILLPEGAPARLSNRASLWNEVERVEVRKDAQLAREVEFSIPREMSQEEGIRLARDVADLNVHWDIGPDGAAKPHAQCWQQGRSSRRGSVRRCATGTGWRCCRSGAPAGPNWPMNV